MPMPQPPFNSNVDSVGGNSKIKTVWQNWFQLAQSYIAGLIGSGPTSARPTKNLWVGQPFFDTTINVPVYWDGSAWITSVPSTVVTAVTGTAPIASSGGTTPNISISQSGTGTNGYLSSVDWNTFNNKQPAGSYVTSVGGAAPIASSGGTNPTISIPVANSTTNGYLTSTDWARFNNGTYVNVLNYGASPSASASANSTAFQNAFNTGGMVYVPTGTYNLNPGLTTSGAGLIGDGPLKTVLNITGTDSAHAIAWNGPGDTTYFHGSVGPTFSGFQIAAISTRSGGGLISITPSVGEVAFASLSNIFFYGGSSGFYQTAASHWNVTQCSFLLQSTAGVFVQNTNDVDSGDSTISQCTFNSAAVGVYQVSSGGLKIENSKFLGGNYGYFMNAAPASKPVADLLIVGCSLENMTTSAISFNFQSGSVAWGGIVINGNQFGSNAYGITASDSSGKLSGITITGNNFSQIYSPYNAISIDYQQIIYISGNQFHGNAASSGGISLGSSATYCNVGDNNYQGVTYPLTVSNSSTYGIGFIQRGSGSISSWLPSYGVNWINSVHISYSPQFLTTPDVVVSLSNPATSSAGGIGYLVQNSNAAGFDLYIIAELGTGSVNFTWKAYSPST